MSTPADRAVTVATAIIQIITAALRRRWDAGDPSALSAARAAVTNYLRDEIHDIERTVRDEIRLNED